MPFWDKHALFEKNPIVLIIGIVVVVAIGGLVEAVPLFYLKSTVETVEGVRPRTPLELAGFNIYVREGCYNCHSQQIRTLRDDVERYGPYSLAAESLYDHPFQWGSKRTGPDLARVGGKYSDAWHLDHLRNPVAVVPGSIMPPYAFLEQRELDFRFIADDMRVLRAAGVPYTEEQIERAQADLVLQTTPDDPDAAGLQERYPNAVARRFRQHEGAITEADALIAYLQHLGTDIDFTLYDNKANIR